MVCRRCSWIQIDGAGDYCNGCGARHGASAQQPQARVMARPSFGVDIASASLLLTLFALLVIAAR